MKNKLTSMTFLMTLLATVGCASRDPAADAAGGSATTSGGTSADGGQAEAGWNTFGGTATGSAGVGQGGGSTGHSVAGLGGAGGEDESPCPGLEEAACREQWRCRVTFGTTPLEPCSSVYAGCRTIFTAGGDMLLGTSSWLCARESGEAPCFLFIGGWVPDGWIDIPCHELPESCGMTGLHPAWPGAPEPLVCE